MSTTTATTPATAGLLLRALTANAAFSAVTGAAALLGAGRFERALGVPWPLLALLGTGLLGFAALVAAIVRRPTHLARDARQVIAGDVAWVVAAVPVVVSDLLTTTGDIALVTATMAVGLLAAAQTVGLRRLQ